MKKTLVPIIISLGVTLSNSASANDNRVLLNAFHDYGISKCDNFILKNSELNKKNNWNIFIDKHPYGIDGPTTEVTLTTIWGTKGDTVKTEDTYIQTRKKCFLRKSFTVTFPGACSKSIDRSLWKVSHMMPNKDYTTYKNAGGVELHAKEISIGRSKVCLQETGRRTSGSHD